MCLCDERNNKFASCLSLYSMRYLFLENLHTQSLHRVGGSGQRHDPAALPPPPGGESTALPFEVVAERVPEPVWTYLGMINSPTGFRTPFCPFLNLI